MSRLRLFSPEDVQTSHRSELENAKIDVLSYARFVAGTTTTRQSDVLTRARTIHGNRTCPHCNHPVVEPVELDDAALNRNSRPIPGTATLVGFHCSRCRFEWPA
jgi:hypothetical protein